MTNKLPKLQLSRYGIIWTYPCEHHPTNNLLGQVNHRVVTKFPAASHLAIHESSSTRYPYAICHMHTPPPVISISSKRRFFFQNLKVQALIDLN